MKRSPHLISAAAAFLFCIIAAAGFNYYAQSLEQRYINTLNTLDLSQFANGSALQRAAIKQPDLLTLYGSSEITMLNTKYEASTFFAKYPTGFAVFDVANMGASNLTIAQSLAALGPDLRGKKVVISFTPSTVTMGPGGGVNADNYNANFSDLHANELTFSPYLSIKTKHEAALRMLNFPDPLKNDPLLDFALNNLANDSPANQVLYYLSWPLGRLQIAMIRLQDHRAVVSFMFRRLLKPDVKRTPSNIDWTSLVAAARAEQIKQSDSNPYGIDNSRWPQYKALMSDPLPTGSRDAAFMQHVDEALDWQDLDIMLQVLQELGAKPLILARPMNVQIWETLGVSEQAQNFYYQKLHSVVDPYHVPLVDFHQYGTDKYFSIDMASHTSREGWIYVDQTLDAFFHGRIQ
ncbi:MAG: D-alanyl-lipoteichoic acid biosynthesis protein DltD [Chloroflexi bacterium]|nr:D-alanyl-lipoteichoic acid biosynthesis protein DltD [Chloroflexota bacterium]